MSESDSLVASLVGCRMSELESGPGSLSWAHSGFFGAVGMTLTKRPPPMFSKCSTAFATKPATFARSPRMSVSGFEGSSSVGGFSSSVGG